MIADRCRLCLGGVQTVLSLTPTPIANNFTKEPQPYAPRFPLDLVRCMGCGHVQIGYAVSGQMLFNDYKYRTPEVERTRLAQLSIELSKLYPQAVGRSKVKVLEIGGNSGIFTQELNKAGFWAVGMDPAGESQGLPKWFNSKSANSILSSIGKIKLIVANNVFAHVDDLRNIFVGIDRVLDKDGVVVFEVQYLPDLVRGGMFDMIYHEHKDYHTLAPLPGFLKKFGFGVSKVEHISTHGGSIRVHCHRGGSIKCADPAIDWKAFQARIEREKKRVVEALDKTDCQVIALGATAKACTLIHHFGIQDRIAYCVDSTPEKIDHYIPGTGIKILPINSLRQSKSDKTIFLTAWNYADTIKAQFSDLNFIVPFEERKAA